jgi:hypothetical protein
VRAVFIEMPAFARLQVGYLDDDEFCALQAALMIDPEAGDLIPGTGGLRKLRVGDARRGKGKRGGLRVVYYWWVAGAQIWLFMIYGKEEMNDMTPVERKTFRAALHAELAKERLIYACC